jgi:hypothetical protein
MLIVAVEIFKRVPRQCNAVVATEVHADDFAE